MTVQDMPTGQLLTAFRDACMKLGREPSNRDLLRTCDQMEEEINRRMAWG